MRTPVVRPSLAIAAVAAMLVACGAPTPPAPSEPTVSGSVYSAFAEAPDPIAVGWVMLAPEFLPAGVSPADLVEIVPNVFAGEFAVIVDGAFTVRLPTADEVPAQTMMPLADAVFNFESCTVEASPPAALASATVFDGVAVPGLLALTSEGSGLMVATEVELAEGAVDPDATYFGWIFVDRDAQLSATGCDIEADLDLAAGWNQLAWTEVGPSVTLAVVAATDVFAALAAPFPPTVVTLSSDAE